MGRKTKLGRKLLKLDGPQSFREVVGCLKIGDDVLKVNILRKDTFLDEVVVHLNVLCSSMEDGDSSKMDTTEIVAVEQVWIVDGDVQILVKYPLEPYDFTCSHNCAPVFGLCALKCDNRLLFAAPRYCSTAREKTNTEIDRLSTL